MSAPDLAEELRTACGEFEQWRSDDDDDDLGYAPRAGTEVYDAADDEDEEDEDEDDLGLGPVSVHSIARSAIERQSNRQLRPKTEVSRFHGMELTSIINMIDLEGSDGGRPLVDLNAGPRLDSGPRLIDSGPQALGTAGPQALGTAGPQIPGAAGLRPSLTQQGMGVPVMASDLLPTAPRAAPFPQGMPPGPQPMGMPPQRPSFQQSPRRDMAPRRAPSPGRRKQSRIRPWMVIAVIVILAGIVAILVAMSGPDVPIPKK